MAKPWEPEIDVAPDLARRLIRSQFPAVAADRIETIGAGWDNVVFRVDDDFAFRFPRRRLGGILIGTELAVLPRIADRLPLPIPAARFAGAPADGYPFAFAGASYLPGRPAPERALDAAGRGALAAPLGGFLRALHDVPAEVLDGTGVPGDRLGRMDLARHLPVGLRHLDEVVAAGWIPDASPWHPLVADLSHGTRPVVLVHGDLYAAHLLLDDAGAATGVIDWGDTHLGDPAMDLMIAFAFLPAAARPAFFTAYGPIDAETERLARARAVLHALWVMRYAADTGKAALFAESRLGLDLLREHGFGSGRRRDMGWGRMFLLGNPGQQMDIEDQRNEIRSLRREMSRARRDGGGGKAAARIDALERENDELRLYVAALIRQLGAKGVLDPAEFGRLVREIDASDGAADGG